MDQTYYVTNQTPQYQNKFNGSIWGSLENAVRALLSDDGEVIYVATGPVYRKVGGSEEITYLYSQKTSVKPSQIPVANYYWKALLKVKTNAAGEVTSASTIGFWFEHKEYSNSTYSSYACSVEQIETYTGLDLFTNLPDGIEATAEANSSWSTFQNF